MAVGSRSGIYLVLLLWLLLWLWLLYPIFHYTSLDCQVGKVCREIPRMTGHVHVACACA